jgi:glycosyltransferase involved in cell wall biosynthesis
MKFWQRYIVKYTNNSPKKKMKFYLVGVWVNRNWILGTWIKKCRDRYFEYVTIFWVPSVYAGKRWWEKFTFLPLPNADGYFFSYPTIFEKYLNHSYRKVAQRSVVNYTHNLEELGDLQHQVKILNMAYSVHFNCSRDAESLVKLGLEAKKVRLVFGAIDSECQLSPNNIKHPKTILLASNFSKRKGLRILPEVIRQLPDWNFVALGRNWEKFIREEKLDSCRNFRYEYFDLNSRNREMSKASHFLSLSDLEGGPIPLIEAMKMNAFPIATDTGFARDLITTAEFGRLIPVSPTLDEIVASIRSSEYAVFDWTKHPLLPTLTWERISDLIFSDLIDIRNSSNTI